MRKAACLTKVVFCFVLSCNLVDKKNWINLHFRSLKMEAFYTHNQQQAEMSLILLKPTAQQYNS